MKKAPKIKITNKELCNQDMHNLLGKLNNTPITLNKNACAIHRVAGLLEKKLTETRESFQKNILEKFALKDEKGKMKFNDLGMAEPDPARLDEYEKAVKGFDSVVIEIEVMPLRPSNLVDVRLTAKEIGLLGDFFNENEGPGVPNEVGLHALS